MTTLKIFSLTATLAFLSLFAIPALAHDGVDHETEAEAQAHMEVKAETTVLPIRAIQKAQAVVDQLNASTRAQFEAKGEHNVRIDARVNANAQVKTNSDGQRGDVRALIRLHGGLIRERFVVAFRQFDRILARIESRIEKLQAQGVATASAETELGEAKIAIVTARADAQGVADFVANVGDSADRAAVKSELHAKVRTAHASLKAAHRALIETVRALVILQPNASVNASTSIQVND